MTDRTDPRCTCRNPYDTSRYHEDSLNETLANILWSLRTRARTLILTGRDAKYRGAVIKWLKDKNIPYDGLFMRPEGDTRPDFIVKSELFDEHIAPHYNFLAQFDDRNQVVDGLRAKGVTVYQVTGDGDF